MTPRIRPEPTAREPARTPRSAPFGVADLFKVGIGPSSSHTVGPMKAAGLFRAGVILAGQVPARIIATAHGSLAWTGKGHVTDRAMVLGLAGQWPETIDPARVATLTGQIFAEHRLPWTGDIQIPFHRETDLVFDFGEPLGRHPNGMTFEAFDAEGASLRREIWYSVGGGFVECEGEVVASEVATVPPRHAYTSGGDLLALARDSGLSLAEIARANEAGRGPAEATTAFLDHVAAVMFDCIERGLASDGILPGGLKVRRRAAGLYARLEAGRLSNNPPLNAAMDMVSAFAMAVNEENAAGGRVVTAPTNGASGVIPAVLRYFRDTRGGTQEGIRTFLLTAAVIGDLIKRNASISGAEVGCQGEVGSAAAMAAAGLCAASGGTPEQVLNAAEIGLEHHLGMTCDPIGGLVQIPCIERNAFGAVKAISAASLALHGDGAHHVSLDQAIETMRQTGQDMKMDYRETSRGGLAVNVPEC